MILLIAAIWWTRDRQALWQYVVTYHICAFVTVLSSAFWPSAAPFNYYGFTVLLDFTRFNEHFHALRAGTMTVVPFGNIEGLISMPSFHVIGGLLLTAAVGRTRLFVPVAILNTLLIISTVMIGVHYVVDVLAGITVWGAAVLIHRRYVAHLVPAFSSEEVTPAIYVHSLEMSERPYPTPRPCHTSPLLRRPSVLRKTASAFVDGRHLSHRNRVATENDRDRPPKRHVPAGGLKSGDDGPLSREPDPVGLHRVDALYRV
jgi:hypothetical protein